MYEAMNLGLGGYLKKNGYHAVSYTHLARAGKCFHHGLAAQAVADKADFFASLVRLFDCGHPAFYNKCNAVRACASKNTCLLYTSRCV